MASFHAMRWFARLSSHARSEAPRVLRFLATGLLNTAFGYGLYLLGLWVGFIPVVALAIATVISALFNYLTVSTLVFGERTMLKLPLFTGVYLITYIFNAVLLHVATNMAFPPWLSQLCILPLVVCANYSLIRLLVFRSAT